MWLVFSVKCWTELLMQRHESKTMHRNWSKCFCVWAKIIWNGIWKDTWQKSNLQQQKMFFQLKINSCIFFLYFQHQILLRIFFRSARVSSFWKRNCLSWEPIQMVKTIVWLLLLFNVYFVFSQSIRENIDEIGKNGMQSMLWSHSPCITTQTV